MVSGILTAILMIFSASVSAAEPSLDQKKLEQDVGALFAAKSIDNTTPGCAVGVIENDRWALRKSFGMANLEHNIPITNQSIFRTGSLGKQFTAAAIALLAEEGRLDLDADIHGYLPDLPEYGHQVTVRQMIHHVSGIPDYEEGLPALKTADGKDLRLGNQDYLSIADKAELKQRLRLLSQLSKEYKIETLAVAITKAKENGQTEPGSIRHELYRLTTPEHLLPMVEVYTPACLHDYRPDLSQYDQLTVGNAVTDSVTSGTQEG